MVYAKRCELCTNKCPQAERAHETAIGRMYATKEFVSLQKKVDSGQLVAVVRCENCEWYDRWSDGRAMNHCSKHDLLVQDNVFCSYGKRRCE